MATCCCMPHCNQHCRQVVRPIGVGEQRHLFPHDILDCADGAFHLPVGFTIANGIVQMLNAKLLQLLGEATSPLHAIVRAYPIRLTPPGNNLAVEPLRGAKSMLAF